MISILPALVKANRMEIPFRHVEKIKINQHKKDLTEEAVDALPCMILLLPAGAGQVPWRRLPYGSLLRTRWQRAVRRNKDTDQLITELPNAVATRVLLQTIKPDSDTFTLLTTAGKLAAAARTTDPARIGVQAYGIDSVSSAGLLELQCAALLAHACPMPSYKSQPAPPPALRHIGLHGVAVPLELAPLQAETSGNHLARWLSALPGNALTPGVYRRFVAGLARDMGWRMQFLDRKRLHALGAEAFLAVCQASPEPDAGIVHLRYRPARGSARRPARTLALVGKGICFDTGGVNVKPAKHMNGMHEDMQGSAVALGTLLALTLQQVDYSVDCWLALAENHIGSRAYKPNDVVAACNGTTIEIKHTDAEGRMVLADTLALASREKPDALIDYATLTGACVYALSSRYSGVFSNRNALLDTLIQAGRDSGERVWPFPQDADFDAALKSDIADTLQCTLEGEADHILATRFLNRFVDPSIHWIHVDLSASSHKGGLAHIPTDTTGFGVRFTLHLLARHALLDGTWN
jgi:leucyl aminopeptidase